MSEPMKLTFTSFRDSMNLEGLRVSIDRHTPKLCHYPVLTYMEVPRMEHLTMENQEKIVHITMENSWELLESFIMEAHDLGIRRIIFCDWATKEQIENKKFCAAGMIGKYVVEKECFEFPMEVEYRDGRERLGILYEP